MKIVSIIILTFLCISCSKTNEITKVEVTHIPLSILTSTAIEGKHLSEMSDSKSKVITDRAKLDLIESELNNMELSANTYNNFDVRVLARIQYKSGQTDTLLINTIRDAKFNEKIYTSSSELISLLTDE